MTHALILQDLLKDDEVIWQVFHCKITQKTIAFDAPLPFYNHYDNLSDEQKKAHPLNFELLKHLNDLMTLSDAANLLGMDIGYFKKAWQIKYIASIVISCQPLQLALRFHITNTTKPAQPVYTNDETVAWQSQMDKWQAFGVIDILYKGEAALYSHAQDEITLPALPQYHALPSVHSLSVLEIINQKIYLPNIDKEIQQHLLQG